MDADNKNTNANDQPINNGDIEANPYHDQQLLPGQVIGYGLPTDQGISEKHYTGATEPFSTKGPVVQTYSSSQKPSSNKLIAVVLLGFILLSAILAGAYFVLQTN
jgi:hypothetical protein